MIHIHEIENKNLPPFVRGQLVMAANMAEMGAKVYVYVTADKVTDAPPRIAGQDYIGLPAFGPSLFIGPMTVDRYVDNAENRKLERVGLPYFRIASFTRANGLNPQGWVSLRPYQITSFMLLGFYTPQQSEEMSTKALGEAAQAQPQGV